MNYNMIISGYESVTGEKFPVEVELQGELCGPKRIVAVYVQNRFLNSERLIEEAERAGHALVGLTINIVQHGKDRCEHMYAMEGDYAVISNVKSQGSREAVCEDTVTVGVNCPDDRYRQRYHAECAARYEAVTGHSPTM